MQYSWKRIFLWITDEMRCSLRNQVNHLSKTTRHHFNLRFPLMVFQSFVDQPENLDHLREPPKSVKPVGCKWIYKHKLRVDGDVTVFKARLMAKGYTQRPGVDFEKTYLPVAIAKSIRILLAIAALYQACAEESHWSAVKTILKYLRRTKDMFLIYDSGEFILESYSDASFQSDDDDAKCQSSFVFKLNGGVVAW
ncbi:UNVERIFIED_CONTAM: Retrovirus-related Pol polyprotein from transposon RE2 [Sesamum calycinum]|uniref:Retrovirus-related Pol polyprotein from transposon RE2 n=1 Tax=Sesamum calycinum TaxID=2727403 RepID=A0AAW2J5G6_9LAMI